MSTGSAGFFDWFSKNTGLKIKESYLLPKRLAAGRGSSRITNNDQENTNRRFKEVLEGPVKPPHKLVPLLKQFSDDCFALLEQAVVGLGDFRLKDKYTRYQKTQEQWAAMTPPERSNYLAKHFGLIGASVPLTNRKTLAIAITSSHLPGATATQIEQLEEKAVDLLANGELFHQLVGAIGMSVQDKTKVKVVQWDDVGKFSCSGCDDFKLYRYLCAHTLAVASINELLQIHLDAVVSLFENETAELVLTRQLQPGSGKKPSRRRGYPSTAKVQNRTVNEIRHRPVAVAQPTAAVSSPSLSAIPLHSPAPVAPISRSSTTVVQSSRASTSQPSTITVQTVAQADPFNSDGIRTPTDQEISSISSLRPLNLTQPFHGSGGFENKFTLTFLRAYRSRHPKSFLRCMMCSVDLPHPGMVGAPFDILFTHQERYQFFDRKTKQQVYSPKEAEAPLHARYDCIVKRYPFFSYHLISIPGVIRVQLTDLHKQLLNVQFGYPIF